MKKAGIFRPRLMLLWAGILALVLVIILTGRYSHNWSHEAKQPRETAATNALAATAPAPTTPKIGAPLTTNNPGFELRPFAVAKETARYQWTIEDGRDTNVIRQLAHNSLEYNRMVEENPRIFKRQLVYLKETPASVFEQAKLNNDPVTQLTLPGVDGQELQFQIVQQEGNGSSRQGQFSGHLTGNSDSLVTLAFMDGRQAFTVLSPKENIFVVGEPREDGQVIVKAIDPETYGLGPPENADDHEEGPQQPSK